MTLTRALAVAALSAALPALALAQQPERYKAYAVNLSTQELGPPTMVDIVIERLSSDAEEARLVEAFQKSSDALLTELQAIRPRAGYIQLPGETGWDIRYANKAKGEDGGWQIVVLTDRRIGFQEAADRPRTIDYPFTLIEMRVNDDGVGEGRASVYTKITWDAETRTLELENYGSEPVRLQQLKRVQ